MSFRVGAVALAFLIIGFEIACFIQRAAVSLIVAHRDAPDTVYVYVGADHASEPEQRRDGQRPLNEGASPRHNAQHSKRAEEIYRSEVTKRAPESFRFDPNTVSATDLMRLGFSEKQAKSIISYREKGGCFRRKTDFARSFVVADSVYNRLEPYIDIPLLDLNTADSAAFDALPGIGGYFAAKMVSFREELGGYSFKEQLLDIWNFTQERYDGLEDLVTVGPAEPFPIWTADEKTLSDHPYIGRSAARAIMRYRSATPSQNMSLAELFSCGIFTQENVEKLSRCRISQTP